MRGAPCRLRKARCGHGNPRCRSTRASDHIETISLPTGRGYTDDKLLRRERGIGTSRRSPGRTTADGCERPFCGGCYHLCAALVARNAHAQTAWKPDGNVEFVVGAGAGGENDRIARAIQRVLTKEHLVDSMTVLNRPGAAQTIAMNYLAQQEGRRQRDRACLGQLHQRHRAQWLEAA